MTRRKGWGLAIAAVMLAAPGSARAAEPARPATTCDSTRSLNASWSAPGRAFALRAEHHLVRVGGGPLALGLCASAAAFDDPEDLLDARLAGMARAGFRNRDRLAWLGYGMVRAARQSGALDAGMFEIGGSAPLAGGIMVARTRHTRASVPRAPRQVFTWTTPDGFQSPPDTFPTLPYWEHRDPLETTVTTLDASLRWRRRAWELEAGGALSLSPGAGPVRVARFGLIRWIAPGIGVRVGGESAAPRWLTGEPIQATRWQMGIEWNAARLRARAPLDGRVGALREPLAWRVVPLGHGAVALRVHAPGAVRVSLRGDFTGWEWIALEPTARGWWEARRDLAPGLYQVEMMIDDRAPIVPPGMAATSGEYGGEVGVFVVR